MRHKISMCEYEKNRINKEIIKAITLSLIPMIPYLALHMYTKCEDFSKNSYREYSDTNLP